MISIKPTSSIEFSCPLCGNTFHGDTNTYFQGKHILTKNSCPNCHSGFWQTLPIGHDRHFPSQYSQFGEKSFCTTPNHHWLTEPLRKSLKPNQGLEASISIRNRQPGNQAILINCLDSCFGHVMTKIWNAYLLRERFPDQVLIVLISSQCEWLCPRQHTELWLVNAPIKALDNQLISLDPWIKSQLARFDSFQLSQVPTHIDAAKWIKMEEVIKIPRFPVQELTTRPLMISFVLREDRFWHNSHLLDFCFRAGIKFGLSDFLRPLFIRRQAALVIRTAKLLLRTFPGAKIAVTGLGISGTFPDFISDQRVREIRSEEEMQRNQLYSQSQLVIGVHGSHMLVPTALAGGFINLVPEYKLPHWVEDTLLPYSGRLLQWMGRFLNEFTSPNYLATHAISMITGFDTIWSNLQEQEIQIPVRNGGYSS